MNITIIFGIGLLIFIIIIMFNINFKELYTNYLNFSNTQVWSRDSLNTLKLYGDKHKEIVLKLNIWNRTFPNNHSEKVKAELDDLLKKQKKRGKKIEENIIKEKNLKWILKKFMVNSEEWGKLMNFTSKYFRSHYSTY